MSGRNGSESVDGMIRNGWTEYPGIRIQESVTGILLDRTKRNRAGDFEGEDGRVEGNWMDGRVEGNWMEQKSGVNRECQMLRPDTYSYCLIC